MALNFTDYVSITSGVIGPSIVPQIDLITRLFTTSPYVPTNSFVEVTSASVVGEYFGYTSFEYMRALFYFSFVSKKLNQPQKLSFASWVATNTPPTVYSDPTAVGTLAQFNAVSSGVLDIQLGASMLTLTGISLTSAASLTAVAAAIQVAIRAAFPSDPVVATATVVYNPSLPFGAGFVLTGGGTAGTGTVSITPASSGVDIGALLGWETPNTIVSQGSPAQTISQALSNSVAASNNFASFGFVQGPLTTANLEAAATWNATQNNLYMFLAAVTASNAAAVSAAVLTTQGVALTLVTSATTDFAEMIPGIVLAATNYNQPNASQNYMFQQLSGQVSSVFNDTQAAVYNPLRINFYGPTEIYGQVIAFYQRGVLCSSVTSPADMSVYANEIWMKSTVGTNVLNALLVLPEIPANSAGKAILSNIVGLVAKQGITNGVISIGNTITPTQQAAINSMSNDPTAYAQVQANGYYLSIFFTSSVDSAGVTEYQGNYLLIYTKNNAIRMVNGQHALV